MILEPNPDRITLESATGAPAHLSWQAPDGSLDWDIADDPATGDLVAQNLASAAETFRVRQSDNVVNVTGGGLQVDGNDVFHAGSGTVDADTLDGLDSAQFLRADQTDELAGNLNVTGSLTEAGSRVRTEADDTAVRPAVSDDQTTILAGPTDISFGANLAVTDDGDGTVSVAASADAGDTHTNVSDDGTLAVGSVGDINFGSNLDVSDDGDGTVSVAMDTISSGSLTFADNTAAVFNADYATDGDAKYAWYYDESGAKLVLETHDGTTTAYPFDIGHDRAVELPLGATVGGSAVLTEGEGGAAVSDDGTQVMAAPDDVNYGTNLAVTDDGDGTVTVDAAGGADADTLDGLDSTQLLRSDAADSLAGPVTIPLGTSAVMTATTDLATGGASNTHVSVFASSDVNTGTNDVNDVVWRRNAAGGDSGTTPYAFEVYDRTTDTTPFAVLDGGGVDFGEGQAYGFRLQNTTSDLTGSLPGTMWLRTDL